MSGGERRPRANGSCEGISKGRCFLSVLQGWSGSENAARGKRAPAGIDIELVGRAVLVWQIGGTGSVREERTRGSSPRPGLVGKKRSGTRDGLEMAANWWWWWRRRPLRKKWGAGMAPEERDGGWSGRLGGGAIARWSRRRTLPTARAARRGVNAGRAGGASAGGARTSGVHVISSGGSISRCVRSPTQVTCRSEDRAASTTQAGR